MGIIGRKLEILLVAFLLVKPNPGLWHACENFCMYIYIINAKDMFIALFLVAMPADQMLSLLWQAVKGGMNCDVSQYT